MGELAKMVLVKPYFWCRRKRFLMSTQNAKKTGSIIDFQVSGSMKEELDISLIQIP